MQRIAVLFIACLVTASAQQSPRGTAHFRKANPPRRNSALVDPRDLVFPDVDAGGGWETILTFVNMSGVAASFNLTFYDDSGNAREMPILNSDGSVSLLASIDFALDPNTTNELVLPNTDSTVNSVWGYLSPSPNTQGIAGLAVVRSKDSSGNIISEATESLSNIQDYDFFAPYDNLEGISTSLVLVNPSNNRTATVNISAQDASGTEILVDTIQVPAGARSVISLPDVYPVLSGTTGKLRVTGDAPNLAALCFRTNPYGGIAYSPIFNWSGLFH